MGKTCAWCGTVLRTITGASITTAAQTLCQGCLEELQTALSTNGLRPGKDESPPH